MTHGPEVHTDGREAERGRTCRVADNEEGPPGGSPRRPDEDADALPPGDVDAARGETIEDEDAAHEEGGWRGGICYLALLARARRFQSRSARQLNEG